MDLELNGHRAHVEDVGSGPPVVLVHGLGGTAAGIWRRQLPELASEFRVVAYDLRGSGRSEVTPGPYAIDLLRDDLRALVEQLELGEVTLVGHSMGGLISLAYAARHPGDVRALVGVGSPTGFADEMRAGLQARAATVEAEGMEAVAATIAAGAVAPSFHERSPAELEQLTAMIAGNDPHGYAAQCRAAAAVDVAGRLGAIGAPVLLVSGDCDAVTPPATTAANAALVADGRSLVLEDCGHTVTWERPDALADAAWSFLRSPR